MPRLQRNHFPWLSMTDVIFHDFPGLESSLIKFHDFPWLLLHHIYMQDNKGDLRNEIKHKYHHCDKKLAHLPRELIVCCASSPRMRVMNHNWSATKQRLQPQSVAEISRHSVLSGDRIRQCETSSGSLLKDTDQCLQVAISFCRHRSVHVSYENGSAETTVAEEIETRLLDCGVTHYVNITTLSWRRPTINLLVLFIALSITRCSKSAKIHCSGMSSRYCCYSNHTAGCKPI